MGKGEAWDSLDKMAAFLVSVRMISVDDLENKLYKLFKKELLIMWKGLVQY